MIYLQSMMFCLPLFLLGSFRFAVTQNQIESNCTCVPYYQCSEETGSVIRDGSGLVDIRDYRHSQCMGYFDMCCNATVEVSEFETEQDVNPQGCGYHAPRVFPWSMALRYQKDAQSESFHACGASLVHPQVAVTAAHCVNQTGMYTVNIGKQTAVVSKVISHPNFNIASLHNDVAVLILNTSFELSDELSIICIPPPRFSIEHNHCIAASWKQSENNDESSRTVIKLPIIPKHVCEDALRATRLGMFFNLHKSFICAGGEIDKDTCDGDGGNPLVCPISGERERYHQVGIVSWGIGCGKFNLPGVYVNLGMFRNWIDKIMLKYKFDINSYRY